MIKVNVDGVDYYKFTAEYFHEGKIYSFDVWALDWYDAEKRLEQIKLFGAIVGQVHSEIEVAPSQANWVTYLVSLDNWVRNLFR